MVAHMLRTFEILHVRSINEIPCCLNVPTANGSTPMGPHTMPVGLQDVLFLLNIGGCNSPTDVAHGNGEGAFPAGALGPWVCPLALEC